MFYLHNPNTENRTSDYSDIEQNNRFRKSTVGLKFTFRTRHDTSIFLFQTCITRLALNVDVSPLPTTFSYIKRKLFIQFINSSTMSQLLNFPKRIQLAAAQRSLDSANSSSVHQPKFHNVVTSASRNDSLLHMHTIDRRQLGVSLAGTLGALAVFPPSSDAVQGNIAGRIPGVTGPDKDGYYTYTRPEGKSGMWMVFLG